MAETCERIIFCLNRLYIFRGSESRSLVGKCKTWLGPGFSLLLYIVIFLLLTFPVHPISYRVSEVVQKREVNYASFYQLEQDASGQPYAWSRPTVSLYFTDVPRYSPLSFHIRLKSARPLDTAPAILSFKEIRPQTSLPLGEIKPDVTRSSVYQEYELTIPPCQECRTGVLIEISGKAFLAANDTRALGVVISDYSLGSGVGHLRYLIWPQPFFLIVLIIGLGLISWAIQLGLSWISTSLLLLPVACYLAIFHPYIAEEWPWLLGLAASVALTSLGWVYFKRHGQPVYRRKWWLLGGTACFVAFMCISPQFSHDITLFLGWIRDLTHNPTGPLDIYRHSPRLDYPPLISYILWLYAIVTGWFGLAQNGQALKVFYALPVIGLVWLSWSYYFPGGFLYKRLLGLKLPTTEEEQTSYLPAFALLAFGAATVFDAGVWGQTDIMACLMLVATLFFINYNWAAAGVLLGLDVIFKPQCWFLAPFFAFLIILRFRIKFGLRALILGGLTALVLAISAFGFDPQSFNNFLYQPELGGQLNTGSVGAYNLFSLLGFGNSAPPIWLEIGGLSVSIIVMLLIMGLSWHRQRQHQSFQAEISWSAFGAALIVLAIYLFAPKMHERYLVYALVFLALSVVYNSRLLIPFLFLNGFCFLTMLTSHLGFRRDRLPNTFFTWRQLLAGSLSPALIAVSSLLIFGWLLFLFWRGSAEPLEAEISRP